MSAKAADYHKRLTEFMADHVLPAEKSYDEYRAAAGPVDSGVPSPETTAAEAARAAPSLKAGPARS